MELLRFLRAAKVNTADAWKMIMHHAQWRVSPHGPDAPASNAEHGYDGAYNFSGSPLHAEAFWLGVSKTGLPTLVIRTQVHDGIYYNEDPKIFTRSILLLIIRSIASLCVPCWLDAESYSV